jgi:hypothetical protein
MLIALVSAAHGPAAISRTRRAVHLSLCAIPAIVMLVIGSLFLYYTGPGVVSIHPHVRSLRAGEARVIWRYLGLQTIIGLMVAGTLGLLSAFASRGGIALRLMSLAVVTRNGTRASASRARLRAVVSWLPVLAAAVAAFAGHSPLLTLTPPASHFSAVRVLQTLPVFFPNEPSVPFVRLAIITGALVVFTLGVIVALIKPERGLQDRLAGTWLVPR